MFSILYLCRMSELYFRLNFFFASFLDRCARWSANGRIARNGRRLAIGIAHTSKSSDSTI